MHTHIDRNSEVYVHALPPEPTILTKTFFVKPSHFIDELFVTSDLCSPQGRATVINHNRKETIVTYFSKIFQAEPGSTG